MDVLGVIQKAIDWLASPVGKTLALYVSGLALRAWPSFFNKAIPVGTAAVNAALTLLGLLSQAAGGGSHQFALAAAEAAQPTNLVLDVILPQLIADGAYNWPRKVWKWVFDHAGRVRSRN